MSRIDSTENREDLNIGGIFGDFTFPETTEDVITDDPEVVQQLPEGVIKDLTEVEDVEEVEEEDSVTEDVEENSTEDTEDNSTEDVEYSYKAIAQYLAEQGVIDYEDSEDIEDSPELLEGVVLQTAKNMVEEYKESIPEEAKGFLDYLEKGGDPSKYLESLTKPIDFENIDLGDENNQKIVLREFLKTQDYSPEEIEDELKDYEDALILEKKAKTASKKLEKIHSQKKQQLIKQQEAELAQRQKDYQEYISQLEGTINNSSTLGGLSVGPNEKKEFQRYLLARDKEGLTQYEREVQENPIQTQLDLAYLKFKKFDFSKLANKVKTQETKRIKGLIKTKDTSPQGKSRTVDISRSGSLDAFKSL